MDRQSFLLLTTSSQWMLFLGMGLIIYSWIEPKKITRLAGQIVFILLGLFSAWIITTGQIVVPEVTASDSMPVEARALSYFHWLLVTGILGVIGLIMPKMKPSLAKIPNILIVLIALILFFMVYNLQRQ